MNKARTMIGKIWKVKAVLGQELLQVAGRRPHIKRGAECSSRVSHWPEIREFLSSYGGNPGNEGNCLLLHRVMWRIRKAAGNKGPPKK